MKEELVKSELNKDEVVKYNSPNPNVKAANIGVFSYRGKKLYQPRICTASGKYVTDRCAYYDIEEAKKSIDAYSDKDIRY